jgi:hypothetical protein
MFVLRLFNCERVSNGFQHAWRDGNIQTPSPAFGGSNGDSWTSDASSSISVVSVPFEVTGDGPTMSLGLMAI